MIPPPVTYAGIAGSSPRRPDSCVEAMRKSQKASLQPGFRHSLAHLRIILGPDAIAEAERRLRFAAWLVIP